MLRVDLTALAEGPVVVAAEVPSDDPIFEGMDFALRDGARVTGTITLAGPEEYLWRGKIAAGVCLECRRCLAEVKYELRQPVQALFVDEVDPDDPAVYKLQYDRGRLVLGQAVREEIILGVPQYVLCGDGCKGLCQYCGQNLNEATCDCTPPGDPRWAALQTLKKNDEEME